MQTETPNRAAIPVNFADIFGEYANRDEVSDIYLLDYCGGMFRASAGQIWMNSVAYRNCLSRHGKINLEKQTWRGLGAVDLNATQV